MSAKYERFLLVSDLDGTLIAPDGGVSAENREAVARFTEGGGRFAVATGRPPINSRRYLAGVTVNSPSIFFNGAMLYDWQSGRCLQTCTLRGPLWRRFAAACCREFPSACIEVYTAEHCYVLSDPEYDDPRLKLEYRDYVHAELAAVQQEEWLKFFLCAPREQLAAAEQLACQSGLGPDVGTHFYSAENYLEFVGPQVSKGAMLKALRRMPGNEGRLVVAAGDFPNDIAMLQQADCGVAPADGEASTRAAADRIGVSSDVHLMRWIIDVLMPEL